MTSQPVTKKSLGQHWLNDESILDAIVEEAAPSTEDVVLEIGPGPGSLTNRILPRVKKVVAVEFDEELANNLPSRLNGNNIEVINTDILDFDYSVLPGGYKVIGNIPYYITSHLVRKLLEAKNRPSVIVLLVQKEVAERIVAAPGKMSLLSVAAQFYADTDLGQVVGAEKFTPPPKVDSQVVVLRPKEQPIEDTQGFFRIVKAGFGERRKKLSNTLAGGLQIDKALVANILKELHFNENVRAQELSVEQWLALYWKLENELKS